MDQFITVVGLILILDLAKWRQVHMGLVSSLALDVAALLLLGGRSLVRARASEHEAPRLDLAIWFPEPWRAGR